jgi:hypothetical protein
MYQTMHFFRWDTALADSDDDHLMTDRVTTMKSLTGTGNGAYEILPESWHGK